MRVIFRVFLLLLVIAPAGLAQSPAEVFESRCTQCHKQDNNVGAPLPGTLRQMSWQSILAALETGKMASTCDPARPDNADLQLTHGAPILLEANCVPFYIVRMALVFDPLLC